MNIQSAARDTISVPRWPPTAPQPPNTSRPPLQPWTRSSRSAADDARKDAEQIKLRWRAAQENFLRRHVGEIYDAITGNRSKHCGYASCSIPWPIVFQACCRRGRVSTPSAR